MYDFIIVGGGISGLYMQLKLINLNKNILLLEQYDNFGGRIYQYNDKKYNISFPTGAARFSKSHTRVINLLKQFKLLDFRTDKGGSAEIDFVDVKQQFNHIFNNENGFKYIQKVLNHMKNEDKTILMNLTFSEYAKKVLTKEELEFMLIASGYSGQLKYMNANDAYFLFSSGIRTDIKFWGGKYHLLVDSIVEYLKSQGCKLIKNTPVKDVIKLDDKFKVILDNKNIFTKKIIFCTPKRIVY